MPTAAQMSRLLSGTNFWECPAVAARGRVKCGFKQALPVKHKLGTARCPYLVGDLGRDPDSTRTRPSSAQPHVRCSIAAQDAHVDPYTDVLPAEAIDAKA